MIVVGSTYWNIGYGQMPGDVCNDEEGLANMRNLGQNMSYAFECTEKLRIMWVSHTKELENMKQILCVMISILLLITVTACTAETPNSSADNTELQETDNLSEFADGSNAVTEILVAYFFLYRDYRKAGEMCGRLSECRLI